MLKTYSSPNKNNYFAPEWRFDFFEETLNNADLLENLKTLILDKEPKIIEKFPQVDHDGGTGLGPLSLTARFSHINFFTWTEPEFKEIQEFVFENYYRFLDSLNLKRERCYISGWINVMRQGQHISPHWHSCFPDSYLGGHLIVACQSTSTYYRNPYNANDIFQFKNNPGNLTFFPNHLVHWTDQHTAIEPRITLAFDIITENYKKNFPLESERYIEI